MFNNLKISKIIAIVLNFILIFELVGWSTIFNYQVKATSPTFEMFVNSENFESTGTAVAPAFNFHVKNGYSGNLNVQLADLNVPDNTQFGISPFSDQLNLSGVPGYVTKSNVSEISKLNVPLGGDNQWNGFLLSISSFGSGVTSQTNTFKIIATAGDYSQEKTITIRYTYQSGDPVYTSINPDWSDGYRHTVNAGSTSTFKMATTSNYDGTINLTGLIPPAEGMSSTIPSSLNMVKDESGAMEIESNKFLYTINTTLQTPNGYYFVSVKTTQIGGPDTISTTRVRVNNSQSGSNSQSDTNNNNSNNSSSNNSSANNSNSQSSSSSTSSSSTSSKSTSTTISKQLSQTVQKQENQIANATNTDEAGSLDDTPGELAISPESGLADTKITLTGKNYPKNTDLKISVNPFDRLIKEKTNWSDLPPFRLVGLIDWGIVKTDENGNFSTYRVFDTTNPIFQALIGKTNIRVGEDKIFNGQIGSSDHPFNSNITKSFTITIPIDDIAQKQTESTAQIWTGKTATQLSNSEKVAVANLTAGLTDPMYNQPFSEEKTPTNQKVVSYSIIGNLGPDGKSCKKKINPDQYAYDNANPLKTLAQGIFSSLGIAKATDTSTTGVDIKALEDCPATVSLSDFWKSPIPQGYTYGKVNDETDSVILSGYMDKLQSVNMEIKNLLDANATLQTSVNKKITTQLNALDQLKTIPSGNKIVADKDGKLQTDLTEYRDFLQTYLGIMVLLLNDSATDQQISSINNIIDKNNFVNSLSLPKIDKEKTKAVLDSKLLDEAVKDNTIYVEGPKNCFNDLLLFPNITNRCHTTTIGSIKIAIKNAKIKSDIDIITNQLISLSRKEDATVKENQMLLLLAYYADTRKIYLPSDYSDEEKTQLAKIDEQKHLVINTNSLMTFLSIKEAFKNLGKEINKTLALAAYSNLTNYADIKYRYLLKISDNNSIKGIDYINANQELASKITDSTYPEFINPEFADENAFLDDIYWKMSFVETANELKSLSNQLKNHQTYKSSESNDKSDDLTSYSNTKSDFLGNKINGLDANNQIKSAQYYFFIPFKVKIDDFKVSKSNENWFNKIANSFKIKKTFAAPNSTDPNYLLENGTKLYNQATADFTSAMNEYDKSKKTKQDIDKLSAELQKVHLLLFGTSKQGYYDGAKQWISDLNKIENNKYYSFQQDIVAFDDNTVALINNPPKPPKQTSQSSSNTYYQISGGSDDYPKMRIWLIKKGNEKEAKDLLDLKSINKVGRNISNENEIANLEKYMDPKIVAYKNDPNTVDKYYTDLGGKKILSLGPNTNITDNAVDFYNNEVLSSSDIKIRISSKTGSNNVIAYSQMIGSGSNTNRDPVIEKDIANIYNDKKKFTKTDKKPPCSKKKKKTSLLNISQTAYATDDNICLDADEIDSDILDATIVDSTVLDARPTDSNSINSTIIDSSNLSLDGVRSSIEETYKLLASNDAIKEFTDEFGHAPDFSNWHDMIRFNMFYNKDRDKYHLVDDVYSGGIPQGLVQTWDSLVGKGFRPMFAPAVTNAIKDAAKNGKCGYQEIPCDIPGGVCKAVILCDNGPTPGTMSTYNPALDRNERNNVSSIFAKTAYADSTTDSAPTINYTNFIHLSSDQPVGLLVIDPMGRAVGWNPISQNEVNQITNTSYNGIDSAKPEMLLRGLVEGNYKIRLVGLDDGPYKVNLAIATGDQVWTKTYQGMIKKNEIVDGNFNIGMQKQSTLTLTQRILNNPYYKFGGLSLIILVIIGSSYYYIHNKNQVRFLHLKP